MLVLADRGRDHVNVAGAHPGFDLCVRQQFTLCGYWQVVDLDRDVEDTLHLKDASFGRVQQPSADYLRGLEPHPRSHCQRRALGLSLTDAPTTDLYTLSLQDARQVPARRHPAA